MDRYVSVFALAILIASVGCNRSSELAGDPSSSNSNASGDGATNSAQPTTNLGSTPDKAVTEFLEAVRTGNDEAAAALLTPTARQKTAEEDLAVAPPGRPTAKFTVGAVDFVTPKKDGAHVFSTWKDVDETGQTQSYDIIWVLRKEIEGWRIVGSVMKIFPDRDPLVLDYEDPKDMKRKLEMVDQEEMRSESQPSVPNNQPQAQAPNVTAPAVR